MEQREHFVEAVLAEAGSMRQLCFQFGISRKTGYKWFRRYMEGCELTDRSRRPRHSPHAIARDVEQAIVAWRHDHPRWGPRKLRDAILRASPGAVLPSVSAFALVLQRNGLVVPRKRRRKVPPSCAALTDAKAPNALWCIDFKGDFPVGKRRCYPLTITDAYSRYLLACVALPSTEGKKVRRILEDVFRTYGLPAAIRSDNGSPFASAQAPLGLSTLSVWWTKLGIEHQRIQPGKPQQNGRHERMHLTLKLETEAFLASTMRGEQRILDSFRHTYNNQRPHEALGGAVPADFYERSKVLMPHPVWGRDFTYPDGMECSRIDHLGNLPWHTGSVPISTTLAGQLVGLDWREDGTWPLHFGPLLLGHVKRTRGRLVFTAKPPARHAARTPRSSLRVPTASVAPGSSSS